MSDSNKLAGRGLLTGLLAGLIMLGPFSIDTMFPGFPAMEMDLQTSAWAVQQTVSVYLFAYAIMSLAHGPMSDRFGRKPVILAGMIAYVAASCGAAMADSLASLLVWRAVQGMCAGAGIVVARAVIRDLFEGAAAQKLMSQVMMLFGIAPAIAPVVGAQLVLVGGWRGIFWALAVFAAILLLATVWRLPESLPADQRVSLAPRSLARSYGGILGDGGFWPLTVSFTFNFAGLFLYILSAPRVVLELMELSRQGFPWLFVPIIGGMVTGAWLSSRMAGRYSVEATVGLAYGSMLLGTIMNLLLATSLPAPVPRWALFPLYFVGVGAGLAVPTLTLLLLDRFPRHRGAASSMQSFVSLLFNALLAGLIAPLLYADMLRLAIGSTGFTLVGWLAWHVYRRVERAQVRRCKAGDAAQLAGDTPPSEVL